MAAPGRAARLGPFHRIFDWFYPAIRFSYERVLGHAWFSEITPRLWLGGAPTYERDYRALVRHGISAVVDLRAERTHEPEILEAHGIAARQYRVPDIDVPSDEVLTNAVAWISEQVAAGRIVLVHCAKGRGRSATVVAAYLMAAEGMGFDEVEELLTSKRDLVKLQGRHRRVLESWIRTSRT